MVSKLEGCNWGLDGKEEKKELFIVVIEVFVFINICEIWLNMELVI